MSAPSPSPAYRKPWRWTEAQEGGRVKAQSGIGNFVPATVRQVIRDDYGSVAVVELKSRNGRGRGRFVFRTLNQLRVPVAGAARA